MFRNALKVPKEEREFFCSSVFLEAVRSSKMEKTRKDMNARVAGRRKAAAEQLCMDNISTGLNDRVERFVDIAFIGVSVNIPAISLPSFQIFTEPFFSLTLIFSHLTRSL